MKFFHFTSSERIGIIALLIISTSLLFFNSRLPIERNKEIPTLEYKKKASRWYYKKPVAKQNRKSYNLFTFDPNTLPFDGFLALGLSEKQTTVIIRYREKGGKFRTADDFAKIYSLSQETHKAFKPYITIDTSLFNTQKKKYTKYPKTFEVVDLNNATEEDLLKLPHIGNTRACAIIAFREKIGGYYSVSQLKELYGFSPALVDSIKGMFGITTTNIKRFNINTASISEMKSHPYFKYFTAKKIVDYRNAKGVISTPSELLTNKILDSISYRKIEQYITIK